MSLAQRVYRGEGRAAPARLDLDAIRRDNPLTSIVGAVTKLRRAGKEWKACCVFHSEKTPSLTIFNGGQRYHCFGCGASGDVIDFIQQLHGVDLVEAARMLGAGSLPTVHVAALPPADDPDNRSEEALSIWRAAVAVEGTVGEIYLRWRGISIDPPLSLRYAELPYGRRGPSLPCLICCVSSPEGPLQGIQRIFLARDGLGKADVPAPKLSLGKVSGGAIRLAPLDGGEVVVCEGPETGLSLLEGLRRPIWVAAGASMLPAMRFPDAVRKVAIGGDRDGPGRRAARKAAEAYAERGLAVRVFFPMPPHADFNDQIRGARA